MVLKGNVHIDLIGSTESRGQNCARCVLVVPGWQQTYMSAFIIDHEAREIMHLVPSVCPSVYQSVCLSLCALTTEPF